MLVELVDWLWHIVAKWVLQLGAELLADRMKKQVLSCMERQSLRHTLLTLLQCHLPSLASASFCKSFRMSQSHQVSSSQSRAMRWRHRLGQPEWYGALKICTIPSTGVIPCKQCTIIREILQKYHRFASSLIPQNGSHWQDPWSMRIATHLIGRATREAVNLAE